MLIIHGLFFFVFLMASDLSSRCFLLPNSKIKASPVSVVRQFHHRQVHSKQQDTQLLQLGGGPSP